MRFYFMVLAFLLMALPARAQESIIGTLAAGGAGGWLNVTRPLTAEDMKGRLVLLDFWTYGCINCMQIVPDLEALEQAYGDKLLVIGVHSAKFEAEQGNERILAAAQRFGLKHPVVNDSDFAIWKAMKVRAWPTLVLLGPDGGEISRYEGEGHRQDLQKDIDKSLGAVTGQVTPVAALVAPETNGQVLSFPARLAYHAETDMLYIADSGHNRIIGIDRDGRVRVTVGDGTRGLKDGDYKTARFNKPRGIAIMDGRIYVADTNNHALRRIDPANQSVETVAGKGRQGRERRASHVKAREAELASPWDVEPLADGYTLAIAMAGSHQLWSYDARRDTVSVLAGSGWEEVQDGQASRAALAQPSGLSLAGKDLFFVDAESSSLRVMHQNRNVGTLIGTGLFDFGYVDGVYPNAKLQHPQGVAANDKRILIADTYNNVIRVYDRETKILSTMKLEGATFKEPGDILVQGQTAWIANTNAHELIRVDLTTLRAETMSLKE